MQTATMVIVKMENVYALMIIISRRTAHLKDVSMILRFLFYCILVQWRNYYYRTFYSPLLHYIVTFYFIHTIKCDQKLEYGTIKSSMIRISPQIFFSVTLCSCGFKNVHHLIDYSTLVTGRCWRRRTGIMSCTRLLCLKEAGLAAA